MYIANFFIGREYTPGEVLPETVPQEAVDRWLKAGAIREVAPAPDLAPVPAEPPAEEEDAGTEQTPEPETPADEIDEDAEPEEIDVMAGIVSDTKAPSKSKGNAGKTGGRKAK